MAKSPARQSGEPTAPRPHDRHGYELDEWNLPLVGPARVAALEKMGKRDPRDFPEDWQEPARAQPPVEAPAAELKEKSNG